jgi:hypothetical protein
MGMHLMQKSFQMKPGINPIQNQTDVTDKSSVNGLTAYLLKTYWCV